jgi:hypothetical protein
MSSVKVETGKRLGTLWTKEDGQALADKFRTRLIVRTRERHIGADGRPFKPYARDYKIKDGRDAVDLTKTGKLLDQIAARVTPQRFALHPSVPYAKRQDDMRPFFGFTEDEMEEFFQAEVVPSVDAHLLPCSSDTGVANG